MESYSKVPPQRLQALREVLDECALDAFLLSRTANKRYYSGFRLSDAEAPTSGYAGTLLVTRDASLILADSRYTEQAANEAPGWTLVATSTALHEELPRLHSLLVSRDGTIVLEVHAAEDDVGKIIGRGGRTVSSLRTVMRAVASRHDERVLVDVVD